MDLWTYDTSCDTWVHHNNKLLAIEAIVESAHAPLVLITSDRAAAERDTICAVLKILRRCGENVRVTVGLPHPTIQLLDAFKACGASDIWAIALNRGSGPDGTQVVIHDRIPTDRTVCPALHVHEGHPVELSVCGKRNNRLILVMDHLKRWCLSDYIICPHWRGIYR